MAVFTLRQRNGASPGTETNLGSSGNLFNFKTADTAVPADYDDNPIQASDAADSGNSYEVWVRAHFAAPFTSISELKLWIDGALPAGQTLRYSCTDTYETPTLLDSDITGTVPTDDVPVAEPASANVSIAGNLAGSLSAAGYSDYMVFQLHLGLLTPSGDIDPIPFFLSREET